MNKTETTPATSLPSNTREQELEALLKDFHDFCEQRMPYSYHDGTRGKELRARYLALTNRRADDSTAQEEQEEVSA